MGISGCGKGRVNNCRLNPKAQVVVNIPIVKESIHVGVQNVDDVDGGKAKNAEIPIPAVAIHIVSQLISSSSTTKFIHRGVITINIQL